MIRTTHALQRKTAAATAAVVFDLLLPRSRALPHCGGIGNGAQELAAGPPQGFELIARSLQRLLNDAAIAEACRQQRPEPPGAAPGRIAELVQALA